MSRSHDLYKRHTQAELLAKAEAVRADPKSKEGAAGIWIYGPRARKLLSDIAWAISYHQSDKRDTA